MEHLEYSIDIKVDASRVWKVLTQHGLYEQWASAFSPHSTFVGEWREGAVVHFIDAEFGGTSAVVGRVEPPLVLEASHRAIITRDGVEDKTSETAQKWIGVKESYLIDEKEGESKLQVRIDTDIQFAPMFEETWPDALQKFKKVAEAVV